MAQFKPRDSSKFMSSRSDQLVAFNVTRALLAVGTLYIGIFGVVVTVLMYYHRNNRRRRLHQWVYELEATNPNAGIVRNRVNRRQE